MAFIIAALSTAALAVFLVRRRARALPEAPRWRVAGRGGMTVRFACGHMERRIAAFVRESAGGQAWYRRNVWRKDAERVPCHACLARKLDRARLRAVPDDLSPHPFDDLRP